MISEEAIAVAAKIGTRRFDLGEGWFSNGYFAVKHPPTAATAGDKKTGAVEAWRKLTKVRVFEQTDLRIERKTRLIDCECECGHEHKAEAIDDTGQAVYGAGGNQTVIDPRYARLLDGLTVFRDATNGNPHLAMLMGFDEGELVVTVMPLHEPVRNPKQPKAVAR